jgi:flagellin-like protein
MKKGITPIIAIIILLLITIGLAATAWTYLSGFLAGYTKSLSLVDAYCTAGSKTNIVLRNTGVEPIGLGASPCSLSGTSTTCGSLSITRTDTKNGTVNSFNGASISPSGGTLETRKIVTFTDTCTTAGDPHVCTYRFRVSDTGATVVSVPCG